MKHFLCNYITIALNVHKTKMEICSKQRWRHIVPTKALGIAHCRLGVRQVITDSRYLKEPKLTVASMNSSHFL
jgi:hypothetical protein